MSDSNREDGRQEGPDIIRCDITQGFRDWMSQAGGVLAVTTYQAGKVVLVGWNGTQVTVLPRDFDKPMGLAAQAQLLALATRNEITLFANAPELACGFQEDMPGRYDSLYLPRVTYHTAELNVHDIAFGADQLWMVVTRFSCLATLSPDFHFMPSWRPSFVTDLVPEDRCHLNGVALVDGRPRYVTAFGSSDQAGGWREKRVTGGLVLDVSTGEVVARGLSMPHSPRVHMGHLWILNSGTGELLHIDPKDGHRDVVCALPGYLRGLSFVDRFALVGLGTIREKHIFGGLPVQERFPRLYCGVAIIDLQDGQPVGVFQFTSGCTELYDVVFMRGITRPMILNLACKEVNQAVYTPEVSYWLRDSSFADLEPVSLAARAANVKAG